MPRAKSLLMTGLLVLLATPAAAQDWGELDCKLVIEAIRAQEQEAGALRRNVATLETAIRGSDYAFFESNVAPQLEPVPTEQVVRAFCLVEVLLRDHCPAQ